MNERERLVLVDRVGGVLKGIIANMERDGATKINAALLVGLTPDGSITACSQGLSLTHEELLFERLAEAMKNGNHERAFRDGEGPDVSRLVVDAKDPK